LGGKNRTSLRREERKRGIYNQMPGPKKGNWGIAQFSLRGGNFRCESYAMEEEARTVGAEGRGREGSRDFPIF